MSAALGGIKRREGGPMVVPKSRLLRHGDI